MEENDSATQIVVGQRWRNGHDVTVIEVEGSSVRVQYDCGGKPRTRWYPVGKFLFEYQRLDDRIRTSIADAMRRGFEIAVREAVVIGCSLSSDDFDDARNRIEAEIGKLP